MLLADKRMYLSRIPEFLENRLSKEFKVILQDLIESSDNRKQVIEKINKILEENDYPVRMTTADTITRWCDKYGVPKLVFDRSKHIKNVNKIIWSKEENKRKAAERISKPEVREKVIESTKERWKNPEFREKMSEMSKERWNDPELRERMKLDHKKLLEDNPEYSDKLSKAVSKAMLEKWKDEDYRKEHAERTSKQLKTQWNTEEYKDKMFAKGRQRSSLELEVQGWLDELGVEYLVDQFRKFRGLTVLPDFLFKGKKVIEVQGDYWHANPVKFPNPNEYTYDQRKNVRKDRVKEEAYKNNGYKVLYLWESDIKNRPEWCITEINNFLLI